MRDIDVDPVHALNCGTLDIAESIVSDFHSVKRIIEHSRVGADTARNIVKRAVFNENIAHIQVLDTAVDHVGRVEDIELDRLIADAVNGQNLILECTADCGKAVYAGDLHHMTAAFVLESHALHLEISGVSRLYHRVVTRIAVERSAEQGDISVKISCRARVRCVLTADANHVAEVKAGNRHPTQIKNGVIKNMQTVFKAVISRGHSYSDLSLFIRKLSRAVESRLNRFRESSFGDCRGADLNNICIRFCRGRSIGKNRHPRKRQHAQQYCRGFFEEKLHILHLFAKKLYMIIPCFGQSVNDEFPFSQKEKQWYQGVCPNTTAFT